MRQRQNRNDVSIEAIPVDVANSQSDEVEPEEIPEEIRSTTQALATEQP